MRKAIGLLLAALLLVGCRGESGRDTTLQNDTGSISQSMDGTVVAEGVVEPSHWSALGFQAAGEVIEVLVEEGATVAAGDLLVRLDPRDAQHALEQAEIGLQAAQAQLALLEAGARPQEIAAAEAQLKAAEARQAEAAARRDQVKAGPRDSEIAAAEAEAASDMVDLKRVEDLHEKTMECFTVNNPYTGEEQEICPGLGPREEQARYALAAARDALAAAEARLADLQRDPDVNEVLSAEASVQAATAERDAAQSQLNLTRAGPTEAEIAVSEAKVTQAGAAMEAAEAALAHTEVRAPFPGTVAQVPVEVGNVVAPGQVACMVATFDRLQVRTKDVSELDVPAIEPGQSVKVTVDALPEREFEGVVRKVALQSDDFRGEAVFTITIDLVDAENAPLRWGMTAWAEFGAP